MLKICLSFLVQEVGVHSFNSKTKYSEFLRLQKNANFSFQYVFIITRNGKNHLKDSFLYSHT